MRKQIHSVILTQETFGYLEALDNRKKLVGRVKKFANLDDEINHLIQQQVKFLLSVRKYSAEKAKVMREIKMEAKKDLVN